MTANMFRSATYRMYWWTFGRWIALVGLIGLVATSLLIAGDLLSSLWSISLGLSLGLLLVSFIAGLLRQLIRGRSALTEGRFRFLAKEDGLTVEGPFGAQTIRWTAYKRAYRDNRFIYLVLSRQVAQVIPLSIVPNDETLLAHLR